jgi:hypothetical protein
LKRERYLSGKDKTGAYRANVNTYWYRTVERVLNTMTPLSVFLRDAGRPDERSSQVWASIIQFIHSRVFA